MSDAAPCGWEYEFNSQIRHPGSRWPILSKQRELILKRGGPSSSHSHYGASRYEWDLGRIAVAEREHRSLNGQIEFLLDRAVREKPPNEPRPVRLSERVVPERGLEPPRP